MLQRTTELNIIAQNLSVWFYASSEVLASMIEKCEMQPRNIGEDIKAVNYDVSMYRDTNAIVCNYWNDLGLVSLNSKCNFRLKSVIYHDYAVIIYFAAF